MQLTKRYLKSGDVWVWFNAGAIAIALIMVIGLVGMLAVKGLSHFWPAELNVYSVVDGQGNERRLLGHVFSKRVIKSNEGELTEESLIRIANRDLTGVDFIWVPSEQIEKVSQIDNAIIVERQEWGPFYGFVESIVFAGQEYSTNNFAVYSALQQSIEHANQVRDDIEALEQKNISRINYQLEQLRLEQKRLELENALSSRQRQRILDEQKALLASFDVYRTQMQTLYEQLYRDSVYLVDIDNQVIELPASEIVSAYRPNSMSVTEKLAFFLDNLIQFLSSEPRQGNTEGGVFPAIFGTVLMVLLMAVIVTPFGVLAAVYLHEYARQTWLTRTIRIAVNNLAGVPSIVYGVFGLGFFVYVLGGNIDDLFYPEAKPSPTFGTPGLLWASLTLALLTLPVVIVSTEEGLSRIPKSIREGSLALGATQFETLWRTVLPMATPAMMTGLILAIARAAGEVAPLMLVGVVKLAPTLPVDGNFPFLHLERKFMHLGFHIYDVGFQSANVEAARPLVYATAFLLVMIIILLNIAAIRIRTRLQKRYQNLS